MKYPCLVTVQIKQNPNINNGASERTNIVELNNSCEFWFLATREWVKAIDFMELDHCPFSYTLDYFCLVAEFANKQTSL